MPTQSQISSLVLSAVDIARKQQRLPISTYRLQFHKDFTFRDAAAIVPYLAKLGITHVYASPYLQARPGSMHGYDVVDHCKLNSEVGTQGDYDNFLAALKADGLTHILDTVPNHIGVSLDNIWWHDVLAEGEKSPFGKYFDINWNLSARPQLKGKVLLPVLGNPYGKVLDDGELKLQHKAGQFAIAYYDNASPISIESVLKIFPNPPAELREHFDSLKQLPQDPQQRRVAISSFSRQLAAAVSANATLLKAIQSRLDELNNKKNIEQLDAIITAQNYRLSWWRSAPDMINYRRFFDVNELAALAMEREGVFDATHTFTLNLAASGKVSGLRIDHPDGLYAPRQYFHRLQTHYLLEIAKLNYQGDFETIRADVLAEIEKLSAEKEPLLYVSAEKILAPDEQMPAGWETVGTSGYDPLIQINSFYVDPAAEQSFTEIYQSFTGETDSYADQAYTNKKLILDTSMVSELHALAHQLHDLAVQDRYSRDFTLHALMGVLKEVIACFAVYRTYINEGPLTQTDIDQVENSIKAAKERNPRTPPELFDYVSDMLLQRFGEGRFTDEQKAARLHFAGKFQQLTAPATAKGVEDTTFYRYNRLLSLNEVGGEPAHFGQSPSQLHEYFTTRQNVGPFALTTLSTHDTKRSEDVRARISVLSEIPDEWSAALARWQKLNAKHEVIVDGTPRPTRNEQYMLYQNLLGAWPLELMSSQPPTPNAQPPLEDFRKRIHEFVGKAMREAKQNTFYTAINEPHEKAMHAYVDACLDENGNAEFFRDFVVFAKTLSHFGQLNSLSQTVLKLVAPGVPDTYQGTELWDYSLVDPDNRRPVDYGIRQTALNGLASNPSVAELLKTKDDGRIKLLIHQKLLAARNARPDLFARGSYEPLEAAGPAADHVFAFARRHDDQVAVIVVSRLLRKFCKQPGGLPIGDIWKGTHLKLPAGLNSAKNLFTGESISADLTHLFSDLPLAVFM